MGILNTLHSRLLHLFIASGLLATGYMVNSFGTVTKTPILDSDYVKNTYTGCLQSIEQGTWSRDIHKAVVNYNLIVATENQAKQGSVFVMFRVRNNPEHLWILAREANNPRALPQWQHYENNPTPYVQKTNAIIPITTGSPIDLSGLPDAGELLVGYSLENQSGTDYKDIFQEMWLSNRIRVIWNTNEYFRISGIDHGAILCVYTEQGTRVERSEPDATYPFIL